MYIIVKCNNTVQYRVRAIFRSEIFVAIYCVIVFNNKMFSTINSNSVLDQVLYDFENEENCKKWKNLLINSLQEVIDVCSGVYVVYIL